MPRLHWGGGGGGGRGEQSSPHLHKKKISICFKFISSLSDSHVVLFQPVFFHTRLANKLQPGAIRKINKMKSPFQMVSLPPKKKTGKFEIYMHVFLEGAVLPRLGAL